MRLLYRAVFTDMDGTLLNSQHQIGEKTAELMRRLAKEHIPFIAASARAPGAMLPYLDCVGVSEPIICYSGALVLDQNGRQLHSSPLDAGDARSILIEIAVGWPDTSIIYYAGHRCFAEYPDDARIRRESAITGLIPQQCSFADLLVREFLPHKILCITSPEICPAMAEQLSRRFPQLSIVRSSPILIEIMAGGVSKAGGINVLLRHLRITADDVIAFGDHLNDIDMLRLAGTGVAMGNAIPEVKQAAHAVTTTNDEEGIAAFLYNAFPKLAERL